MAADSLANLFDRVDEVHHASKRQIKGWLSKAADMVSASKQHSKRLAEHAPVTALTVLRRYGETVTLGALFGVVQAETKNGLDLPVGSRHIPVDGAIAALAPLVAIAASGTEFAHDAANVGSFSAGVYTMRGVERLLRAKRAAIHGEEPEDMHAGADVKNPESEIERLAREIK